MIKRGGRAPTPTDLWKRKGDNAFSADIPYFVRYFHLIGRGYVVMWWVLSCVSGGKEAVIVVWTSRSP